MKEHDMKLAKAAAGASLHETGKFTGHTGKKIKSTGPLTDLQNQFNASEGKNQGSSVVSKQTKKK